jgi:hypothetical protein
VPTERKSGGSKQRQVTRDEVPAVTEERSGVLDYDVFVSARAGRDIVIVAVLKSCFFGFVIFIFISSMSYLTASAAECQV